MTAVQLRKTMRVLVLAVLVVVPLVFWPDLTESFDMVKVSALWAAGVVVIAALAMYLGLEGWRVVPRQVALVAGGLAAALVVATVTSQWPLGSLVGQPARYTGLASQLCLIGLFLAVCVSFDSRSTKRLAWVCTLVAIPVVNYAVLQVSGNDPFSWTSGSFNFMWVSTLANPNIAAAFVAIVLPLIAYTMLRADAPLWVTALSGLAFGTCTGCLSVFMSFQGPVAALTTVLFLMAWAWWTRASLGDWIVAVVLAASVIVVPALAPSATLVIVSGSLVVALLVLRRYIARVHAPASWLAHRRAIAIGAAGVAVVAVAAGARTALGYVQTGWRTGFLERGDFYRAAFAVWRDNPVFGSGFDTFALDFMHYRPLSHALNREPWTTSSVHSVPLGMFTTGGLVLGLAYLAFVALIAITLIRCLRATAGQNRVLVGAVGAAWLAYQTQSLVSVENVSLLSLHVATSGLIVALAIEHGVLRTSRTATIPADQSRADADAAVEAIADRSADVRELVLSGAGPTSVAAAGSVNTVGPVGAISPVDAADEVDAAGPVGAAPVVSEHGSVPADDDPAPPAPRRVSAVIVVAALLLCGAVWWTVGSRPLRASAAMQAAIHAASTADGADTVVREVTRAVELAPWLPASRVSLADVQQKLGRDAEALVILRDLIDRPNGDPYLSERAMLVAVAAGDDELGLAFAEQAVAINPKGPKMARWVADQFVEAAARAADAGDTDLAQARYERALELVPGLAAAEAGLAGL